MQLQLQRGAGEKEARNNIPDGNVYDTVSSTSSLRDASGAGAWLTAKQARLNKLNKRINCFLILSVLTYEMYHRIILYAE